MLFWWHVQENEKADLILYLGLGFAGVAQPWFFKELALFFGDRPFPLAWTQGNRLVDDSLSRFEMICNHNIWQHFWDDELFQNSAIEWLDIWKWRQNHAKRRSGSGLYFVWASSHSLQRNENKKQATFMTLWLWWWVKIYRWCLYILILYLGDQYP